MLSPKHYQRGSIETIKAIMGMNLDPCEANVVKYIARHRDKGGLQDIEKAIKYLNIMKENYSNWYGEK